MKNQVAILHGWSDNSDSFKPLAAFLKKNDFKNVSLWLGDYISKDDDVRIVDIAKRMEAVVRKKIEDGNLSEPFDLIVHSTGGLIARHWLDAYYTTQRRRLPVRRLIMLAPANHGSPLASMGKSMAGRIMKGLDNWLETGTHILNALELASPFQWDLAERDLFVPIGQAQASGIYGWGKGKVAVFVLTGSHPYWGFRSLVNENGGSDGTVRVCAANMNVQGRILDFTQGPKADTPKVSSWRRRNHGTTLPFAILPDRDHELITLPNPPQEDRHTNGPVEADLGKLILAALACEDMRAYRSLAREWEEISTETAQLVEKDQKRKNMFRRPRGSPEYFHQYYQVNIRVIDDHGNPVPDYFFEFFGPGNRGTLAGASFHRQIIEDIHKNSQTPHSICFYVNRYKLIREFYGRELKGREKILNATLSAIPPGSNVRYFSAYDHAAKGRMAVHRLPGVDAGIDVGSENFDWLKSYDDEQKWLHRNCTHYVQIIVPRMPIDKVFTLKRY